MGNFAVIGSLIGYSLLYGLPILFGLLFVLNLRSNTKKIIYGALFILTSWNLMNRLGERSEARDQFLHKYRLTTLNREDCNNCIIDVNSDNSYDLYRDNLKIHSGEWELCRESEIGTYYIKFDVGPYGMIYHSDTIVDYLNIELNNQADAATPNHR